MGHHHHHKLEQTNELDSKKTTDLTSAQKEVDEERKKDLDRVKRKTDPATDKNDSSKEYLPNTTIGEPCYDDHESKNEEIKSNGNRVLHMDSSDHSSEIEYNAQNQPVRYKDFSGEEYENTQPGVKDGVWKSKTNKVQSEGVRIDLDEKTQHVNLTDVATKNVVDSAPNGVETTTYYPSGGQTIRKSIGANEEWISTHDANGKVRAMHIVDNKLQKYVDGEGNSYTRTDRSTARVDDKPYSERPIFQKTDSRGNAIAGDYSVTADRSGNVAVRNQTDKDSEKLPDYARRERVDGVVITSNADNTIRDVKIPPGVNVGSNPEDAPAIIQKTPPGVDLQKSVAEANEHRIDGLEPITRAARVKWFYDQVKTGGPADFKSPAPDEMNRAEYEAYGNYHFGVIGKAAGWNLDTLEREAGAEQIRVKTSKPEWGTPGSGVWVPGAGTVPGTRIGGSGPADGKFYGDDPRDQQNIIAGYDDETERETKIAA